MPIASGGGGSISRLSMTCTSARYPTASATLTTPVEFEWKKERRTRTGQDVMNRETEGASACASRLFVAVARHVGASRGITTGRRPSFGGPFAFGTHP